MEKIWIILLYAAVIICSVGCGTGSQGAASEEEPVSKDFFAMDTYMTVSAYGPQAGEATEKAEEEVYRLDKMLSTGSEQSEIAKLNKTGEGILSKEAGTLVERGLELYKETGGKFDIAIYPVMEAWGFTAKRREPAHGTCSPRSMPGPFSWMGTGSAVFYWDSSS